MSATSSEPLVRGRVRGAVAILALRDVPFWKRSAARRFARVLAFAAYTYVGVLVVLLALENFFLFQPTPASVHWVPPPAGLRVEDVEVVSSDGTPIHGWWSAPPGWTPARGAMLFAHGNAGNLTHCSHFLLGWQQAVGNAVMIFDYPGYGRSGGRPSEAGCYEAGQAAHDWLIEKKGVRAEDVVLFGNSLGGATATELALRRPGRALVLLSTFTSFPDMAQKTYPFLPARWLVRNQLDNLRKIGQVACPVFIAHGTADTLIPHSHGERLFAAAREPRHFLSMADAGHADAPDPRFYAELNRFLERKK